MTDDHALPSPDDLFGDDGPFSRGEPEDLDVLEVDYPTEYSAVEYLAAATLGQPIAVGHLGVHYTERNGQHSAQIGMAIIPGRGIWCLEPVFDDWESARHCADATWTTLYRVFGEQIAAMPIQTAYVPTLGSDTPRGQAPDPSTCYDASLFEDVAAKLRPAPGFDAEQVDAAIATLLETGSWLDAKHPEEGIMAMIIPRWLAERLPESRAG